MVTQKILLSALLLFSGFAARGQNSIAEVRTQFLSALRAALPDSGWTLLAPDDSIILRFTGNFFRNSHLSPTRYHESRNEADTLDVRISFEENWTAKRYSAARKNNRKIARPLMRTAKAYYDSIQWRGVKTNERMFDERPVSHFTWCHCLSKEELQQVKKLVVLPDTIIGLVGVFVDADYRPDGDWIQPQSEETKFKTGYASFVKVLGHLALYKHEEKFW